MNNFLLTPLLSVLLLFLLPTVTATAQDLTPQQIERLKELGQQGKTAFDQGNFEVAADYFSEALTIYKDRILAFYLAICLMKLGKLQESEDIFNDYLETWPDSSNEEEIKEYLKEIEVQQIELQKIEAQKLQKIQLILKTTPPGGRFYICKDCEHPTIELDVILKNPETYGYEYIDISPFTVDLDPGNYSLVGALDEHYPIQKEITSATEKTLEYNLEFQKKPVDIPPPPKIKLRKLIDWSLAGVGVVGLISAIGLQVSAVKLEEEAKDCWPGNPQNCSLSVYENTYAKAEKRQTGSTILFVTGSLSLTAGVALLVWELLDNKEIDKEALRIEPALQPGQLGVQLRVIF